MTTPPPQTKSPAIPANSLRKGTGGRPTLEAAAGLAEVILSAAWTLLLERGYKDLSIEAIARKAAVSKRTIYDRFGSKDGLFEALVERASEQWRIDVIAGLGQQGAPPGLEQLIGPLFKIMSQDDVQILMAIIIIESRAQPNIARIRQRLETTSAQGLSAHFQTAIGGYPDGDVGVRLASSIFGLVAHWGRMAGSSIADPPPEMEARLCREIGAMLELNGCDPSDAAATETMTAG